MGEVVGISIDEFGPYPAHYIVRLLEPISLDYEFDYVTISGSCLTPREE